MAEIVYKDAEGNVRTVQCVGRFAKGVRDKLKSEGRDTATINESYPGEIEDAEALEELKPLLPKLRQIVARFLPVVVVIAGLFILRKLHLVRPDLIPFPIDIPVYA